MARIDTRVRVRDLLSRWPDTEEILGRHGLDLCCGVGLPLEQAAIAAGADLGQLLRELAARVPAGLLENRGLAGAEAQERTLAAAAKLQAGEALEAWFDRWPADLVAELAARGLRCSEAETPEGYRLTIARG